jgi:putative ABC transport system permease protein
VVTLAVIGIGLVLALAMTRLTETLLYDVKPNDPSTFVVVSLVMALVALAASYLPARRASRIDPMQALRAE